MSEGEVFPVPAAWAKRAKMNAQTYDAAVVQVETDADAYWTKVGKRLDWTVPFTQVKDTSFSKDDFHIRWYADGVLNVSVNCLDRHLDKRGDQVAIIWEGDDPTADEKITYRQLHERVCKEGLGEVFLPFALARIRL